LNKTGERKRDYREYYTKSTIEIVADVYQEDIRLFGYDFEDAYQEEQAKLVLS